MTKARLIAAAAAATCMAGFAAGASGDSGRILLAAGTGHTHGQASSAAAGPVEDAVRARHALMELYAFHLGRLGAMAKGAVPYDAGAAQEAADNLAALARLGGGGMWPPGSGIDNPDLAGKTRARAAIWGAESGIADKGRALADAASVMAEAAGSGVGGIREAIGGVARACKGCHQAYRAPR